MKKAVGALVSAFLVVASVPGMALAGGPRRPANDDLAGATLVAELPFTARANIKGASLEADEVQPSCQAMRGTVWYRLTPLETAVLDAEVVTGFPSATAVYEQTADSLVETACLKGSSKAEVKVEASKTYLIQFGSTTRQQGRADISLVPSVWREVPLFEHTYERQAEEQHVPVLKVSGAPRENDPSMYDVTIGVSEQTPVTVGLLTFGLVTQRIEQELVRIPASATKVSVEIVGRYDSSQYTCAADDGNGTCYAGTPLKDLAWLSGGEGTRAELVVKVFAERNGEVLIQKSQAIPYAGQILGLLP